MIMVRKPNAHQYPPKKNSCGEVQGLWGRRGRVHASKKCLLSKNLRRNEMILDPVINVLHVVTFTIRSRYRWRYRVSWRSETAIVRGLT